MLSFPKLLKNLTNDLKLYIDEKSTSGKSNGARRANTAYSEGQIAGLPSMPTGYILECVKPGITAKGKLANDGSILPLDEDNNGNMPEDIGAYNENDFPAHGCYNTKETFTTSGTFVAPVTGWYRITLQGGGGGGGAAGTNCRTQHMSGSGGGQGGCYAFYEKLVANKDYPFIVGAGGSAGKAGSAKTDALGGNGSAGGTTSIVIGENTYAATGGAAGLGTYDAGRSVGGGYGKLNDTFVPGTRGISGLGGSQGASCVNAAGASGFGGGLGGAAGDIGYNSEYRNGGTGQSGYITFEYCKP